jgi:hypothetical protein
MPSVWLAWSMLSFCLSILSYVWRTGSSGDPEDGIRTPLTPGEALAMRTVLSVLFGVGIVFFVMILRTFASYGTGESGWRRSWLTHGQFGRAQRARDRNRQSQMQEEERGRRGVRTKNQSPPIETPVNGLGLSGIPTNGNLASTSAVLLEQPELGKNEKSSTEVERGTNKVSPKL